jgi:hypothetical protein
MFVLNSCLCTLQAGRKSWKKGLYSLQASPAKFNEMTNKMKMDPLFPHGIKLILVVNLLKHFNTDQISIGFIASNT